MIKRKRKIIGIVSKDGAALLPLTDTRCVESVQSTGKSHDYQGILEENMLPESDSFSSDAGYESSSKNDLKHS